MTICMLNWRFWRRELTRGPCYGERRAATEARVGSLTLPGDVLCCDCAGREPTRAAWWRWVYALVGPQRCSRCGREFSVTRRATLEHGAPFDEYDAEGRLRWRARA